MTAELDYLCDTCGQPIGDGQGCLEVFFADITAYRKASDQHRHEFPAGAAAAELLNLPTIAQWYAHHDRCNPRPDDEAYDIDVRRVRSWRDLLLITSELMEKNWLTCTNWRQVIGAAARRLSDRVVERGDAA